MRKIRGPVFTAAMLTLAAGPALAAEFVFAKPVADLASTQADAAACATEARTGRSPSGAPVYVPGGGVAASAGAAAATGFLEGLAQGRAQNAYLDRCMRRRGYAKLALTEAEEAALRRAGTPEARRAWLEAWLRGSGQEARIAAALASVVPALPSAPAGQAFAVHGLQLLPDSVALSSGPICWGQSILSAQANYRSAAKVVEPLELGGALKVRVEQDTTLYLVDDRPEPDGVESSRWCGPLTQGTVWGKRVTRAGCIQSVPEGYAWTLWLEEYRPLLTRSVNPPFSGVAKAGVLRLEPVTERSAPQPVELRLAGLTNRDMTLELVAIGSAKPVAIWRRTVAVGPDNRAVVPFWTRRLVLTRTGRGLVSAALEPGDGRGLAEAPPAEYQR